MAELIIKEVSRSGDNVTYGVFFNPIEYGTVVDLDLSNLFLISCFRLYLR